MDFWSQHGGDLANLGITAAVIAVYTLIVTWLYVPMGQRLMFAKELGERRIATPGRRLAYVFLFPLVSFAFFLVIAAAIFFLSPYAGTSDSNGVAGLDQQDVLTIAMATVLAIRVCAYFNETAADELAKVMPLGLIGFALLIGGLDQQVQQSVGRLSYFLDNWQLVGIYFVIVILVEFLLRLIYELAGRPHRKAPPRPNEPLRPVAPNNGAGLGTARRK